VRLPEVTIESSSQATIPPQEGLIVVPHKIVRHEIPNLGAALSDLTGGDPELTALLVKFAEKGYGRGRNRWQFVRKDRKDEALGGKIINDSTSEILEGTGWEGRLVGYSKDPVERIRLLTSVGSKVRRMSKKSMGGNLERSFAMLETGRYIDWKLLLELESYFQIVNAMLDAQNDLDKVGEFRRRTDQIVGKLPEETSFSLLLNGNAVIQTELIPDPQLTANFIPVSLSEEDRKGYVFLCNLAKIGLPAYRAALDMVRAPGALDMVRAPVTLRMSLPSR